MISALIIQLHTSPALNILKCLNSFLSFFFLCLFLRRVWEQSEKHVNQQDAIASSDLSHQAAADLGMQSVSTYGSHDSLYHSSWSLRGVAGEADDVHQLVNRTNSTDVPSQVNLGYCWAKGYERDPAPKRNIWSNISTPKIENVSVILYVIERHRANGLIITNSLI